MVKNIRENITFNEDGPEKIPIQVNQKLKIMRVSLKKGLEIQPHAEDHFAFFVVLEGKGVFTKGKEKFELIKDEFIYIDANEERGIRALEDLVLLVTKN